MVSGFIGVRKRNKRKIESRKKVRLWPFIV